LNVDTCNPHFQQVHTANFTYMWICSRLIR
jgi:hypothetical protein